MKKIQFRPFQGILVNDNQGITSDDLDKIKEDINNIKNDINTLNDIKEVFNVSHALYPNNNLLSFCFLDNTRIETINQAYAKYNLKNIVLSGITTIFNNCFYASNEYNPEIIDLTKSPNLTTIGTGAFFNCDANTYKLGNLSKLSTIGDGAFLGVNSKLDFSKADNLKTIGYNAFGGVLTEPKKAIWLKFGKNIENITFDPKAFKDCDQHSAIEVPSNLLQMATTKLRAAGYNGFISGYND